MDRSIIERFDRIMMEGVADRPIEFGLTPHIKGFDTKTLADIFMNEFGLRGKAKVRPTDNIRATYELYMLDELFLAVHSLKPDIKYLGSTTEARLDFMFDKPKIRDKWRFRLMCMIVNKTLEAMR
ncbi:MAG: hypothetical protein ACRCX7_09995 [Cetobacterium sp.]|uniref:hypothetical protein n=1 Tax=Cetobacterium sp. TaxID=2071632 RepID=UPI003F3D0315